MAAEPKARLNWDGTINVPTIVAALTVLVGGITFANAMSANVTNLVNQVAESRTDLRAVQSDIGDIKARISVLEERTRSKE